jgi:hypothetical protein
MSPESQNRSQQTIADQKMRLSGDAFKISAVAIWLSLEKKFIGVGTNRLAAESRSASGHERGAARAVP